MKKLVSLILTVLILVSLVSCAKTKPGKTANSGTADTQNSAEDDNTQIGLHGIPVDYMLDGIEADDFDNKAKNEESFEMSAEEFKKAVLTRYPAPKHRPFETDKNSKDDDYLIKAGTLSVYTYEDTVCIALVITKDTHDLGEMRIVVFRAGKNAEFGIYKMSDLISDFGKSEKGGETCDSAIYLTEKDGQLYLFVESAKGYTNSNTDYAYEMRSYIVNGRSLNFCSDLRYKGALGKRLTSRSLPSGFAEEHYTKDKDGYVLYCEAYSSESVKYKEIHNDFTKISEAIKAYFECFGIERSKTVRKSDDCRISYGTGIEKIADFSFHAGKNSAGIALTDYTGLLR